VSKQVNYRTRAVWGIASVFTLASLGAITLVPYFQGARDFSPGLFLGWCALIGTLWATVFAAENISEMRLARLATITPALDLDVFKSYEQGLPVLTLTLTNMGLGGAVGVRAFSIENVESKGFGDPTKLGGFPHLLKPFESHTHNLTNRWTEFYLPTAPDCSLIIRISYRDALGAKHVLRRGYKIGGILEFEEVAPPRESVAELKADSQA
jgi:hypothetical protein